MASSPDSSSTPLATTATTSKQTQESPEELPPTSQDSHPSPPPPHLESPTSPSPHPESSTPPPSHLPTFITALSLKPRHPELAGAESGSKKGSPGGINTDQASCSEEEKMDTAFHQETLSEKFKQEPDYVLSLLRSVVSVDKLTSLLQAEYHGDKKQLEVLQTKLEEAYMTVSECGEKKEALTTHIEETNDKIRTKRKHLEGLRDELKELGEEETQLKKRRDTSYAKCSELKKKLKASREALQQISVLGRSSKQTADTYDNKKAAP